MMANQIDDKPSLPKEYVQLEYLENLPNPTYGRCIIDTGINSSNTRVIMKAQGTSCNYTYMLPIGYYYDYSGSGIFCYKDTKGWSLDSDSTSYTSIPYTDVVNIDVVFRIDPTNSSLGTINNVPVNYTRSNKLSVSTLKLFHCVGILSDYSNRNYGFIGKIFYCRIEDADSGTVLGEYIPALRIADSKPGMYDLATGKFFVNQGTGEFTYG